MEGEKYGHQTHQAAAVADPRRHVEVAAEEAFDRAVLEPGVAAAALVGPAVACVLWAVGLSAEYSSVVAAYLGRDELTAVEALGLDVPVAFLHPLLRQPEQPGVLRTQMVQFAVSLKCVVTASSDEKSLST